MNLRLYNTASRTIEDFSAIHPPMVGLYTCGMTVYYHAHVGHIRAYTNSDVLRRALEYMGFQVRHVMNVTDVGHMTSDEDEGEDKIEIGAQREGKSPWELARIYENEFFDALERSNILRPHVICRATEHVSDMIELIQRLENRGYTYQTQVGIIFDTSKFPKYEEFSRLNLEGQRAGARVTIDPERKRPWDFALWVTNQPNHLMQWDSPWGRGFPGWHIECSAMSMKYLGEELDIHTGGIDHIPVHHTNEIAQSEAATGKRFVRHWFHSAFLNVDGQKMSKSLRNLYTPDDLARNGFSALSLRYFYLGSLYRKTLNFTWEALIGAQNALVRLWQKCMELPKPAGELLSSEMNAFLDAISTDLNTPQGLAILWDVVNSGAPSHKVAATLYEMDRILGLDLANAFTRLEDLHSLQVTSTKNEQQAKELAAQRDSLRKERKYIQADKLREEILDLGFIVEDRPHGYNLKPRGPKA